MDTIYTHDATEHTEQFVEIRTDNSGKVTRSRIVCEDCGAVIEDWTSADTDESDTFVR